jgi:uncharacterized low-complexity protein
VIGVISIVNRFDFGLWDAAVRLGIVHIQRHGRATATALIVERHPRSVTEWHNADERHCAEGGCSADAHRRISKVGSLIDR